MLDLFFLTTLVFDLARPLWMSIADFTYWVLDVLLSFRAGYQKHGKLEMRPKFIARRYVKTWFAPDILLLGIQVLSFAVDEVPGGSLRVLRFARLGKLMRLTKLHGLYVQALQRIRSTSLILTIHMTSCILGLLVWVQCSACIWYAIGISTADGWVAQVEGFRSWPMNYLFALHWASSQFQGGIDIYPSLTSPWERMFALVQLLASCVVLALLVGKLTTMMQALSEMRVRERRLINSASLYMEQHQISTRLSLRIKRFLKQRERFQARDDKELLDILPAQLRRTLLLHVRWPSLQNNLFCSSLKPFDLHFAETFWFFKKDPVLSCPLW
mmetsp:Transcript_102333/g.330108  ORF Transcript_102333/g.330108 Transcript_102333/m.330108 type:complete len:328 (-) Transcript_102333:51-1034(-)